MTTTDLVETEPRYGRTPAGTPITRRAARLDGTGGDAMSNAVDVDMRVYEEFERVVFVVVATKGPDIMDPKQDKNGRRSVTHVQKFHAVEIAIVDEDLVRDALVETRVRIQKMLDERSGQGTFNVDGLDDDVVLCKNCGEPILDAEGQWVHDGSGEQGCDGQDTTAEPPEPVIDAFTEEPVCVECDMPKWRHNAEKFDDVTHEYQPPEGSTEEEQA